jgi:hypothetical protein
MRKISSILVLSATLLVAGTGCLKDKGFEDQKYGIQVSETRGVALIQAAKSPLSVGVERVSAAQTIAGPVVTVEQPEKASSDVKVKLELDNALVTAEGLTPLPAGSFTISTLDPVVKAGTTISEDVKVTFADVKTALDPSVKYGIGFKIAQADQGYQIAKNLKEVVIAVVVNNPYAGTYTVTGYFFHPTGPRAIDDVKTLSTVSPTIVRAQHSDLYDDYLFDFSVEDGTNKLINYVPRGLTPSGAQSGFMSMDVPFATTAPTPPGVAPWVHSTYNNTYDPATKTFWMHYGYGSGASSQGGYTRQVYEKWVRK